MIFKKEIAQYYLDDGIHRIIHQLQDLLLNAKSPVVVLVAGWTASWKTSAVAKQIQNGFRDAQILSMDNYYRGPSFMKQHPEYNFDQPEVLNLELFFSHLKDLKKGKNVKIPSFDFQNDPIMEALEIKSSPLIIVEWLFALNDKIVKLGDIKVFVDLWTHSQILRRLFRDVERTWNKPWDILKYFLAVVWPMHKKYIAPTKKNADIILQNDYLPDLEAKNAKIKDTKLKFKIHSKDIKQELSEVIYKLWGSYVGKSEQVDYFFYPHRAKYKKTGEILKIRKLGFGRYFFSYFGPQDKTKPYDERYTMRFFVDYETLQNFKNLYPENSVEISKVRRNFFIWGVLVSLDELENRDTYIMFKFDEKNKRTIILDILENLWLDARKGLKKSYIELIDK